MSQQSKLQRNERKPMEREGEGEGQKDRHILELQPIRTEDCNIRKVVQDNRHTEMTTWHHANVCFVYTSLVKKKKNCFILSWFRHWRILCKIQTRFLGLKARIDTECLICFGLQLATNAVCIYVFKRKFTFFFFFKAGANQLKHEWFKKWNEKALLV